MRFGVIINILVFLFLIMLTVIFNQEYSFEKSLEMENIFQTYGDRADQKFEAVKRSYSPRIQISNLLYSFQEHATNVLSGAESVKEQTEKLKSFYTRRIRKFLPPHEVAIVKMDLFETFPVFYRFQGMGLTTSFVTNLADYYLNDFKSRRISSETIEILNRKIGKIVKFPQPVQTIFHFSRQNVLQVCNSPEGNFAFYFGGFYSRDSSTKYLLFCLLNLREITPEMPLRSIAESWEETDSGVTFCKNAAGKAVPGSTIASSLFDSIPGWTNLIPRMIRQSAQGKNLFEIGDYLFFTEKIPSNVDYRTILAFRLPPGFKNLERDKAVWFMLSLFIIALSFSVLLRKVVFGRGSKVKIGSVLLATFIIVTSLPVTGVYIISRRTVEEFARKSKQETVRELHQNISRLDEGIQRYHAAYVQRVNFLKTNKAIGKKIRREETNPQKVYSKGVIPFLVKYLSFDSIVYSKRKFFNRVIAVIGPSGFSKTWGRVLAGDVNQSQENLLKVMTPLCLRYLKNLNPNLEKEGPGEKSSKSKIEDLRMEAIFDVIKGIATPEGLIRNFFYPEEVQEFKIFAGRGYIKITPISFLNAVRYVVFLFWDQTILDEPYLEGTLDRKTPVEPDFREIFAIPWNFQMEKESIPDGISAHPHLRTLSNRAKLTRATLRQVIAADHLVLEAMVGVFSNQFIFAGQRDTSTIEAGARRQMNFFRAGMALEIFLATLAAFAGAFYFMKPLREMLGAIETIRSGKFEVKLDDSRPDEFGSLGFAFNKMAEGLQQGQILGNYVSPPVRKALKDEDFKIRATTGEVSDFTVLFSSLFGFEDFQKERKPEEVFNVMEIHFNVMFAAVEKYGGIIDKVIGDKILVYFGHKDFGGGQNAAQAAFQVISDVRKNLKEKCPLESAMGVNSGSAIAGFIGAQNILQDYTVIGDTVNLASRLATLSHITGGTRVVLSNATRGFLGKNVRTEKLPFKNVKGKTRQVVAFLLLE